MSQEAFSPSSAPEEVGSLARIPGALFSPGKTFESIARRPTWLAPLLLSMAFSILITNILLPRVDYERMIRDSFERRGQTLPEERLHSIVESQKKVAPILYNVLAFMIPILGSVIAAVVIWGAFKAFGWDATFRQAFGVTTHAFLPSVVGSLLLLPILLRQETVDPRGVGDLLRSNLGFLVERESKMFHSLAQSIDLFSFWSLILFVIGFAVAAKVSPKAAAGVIVTLWLLYVVGKAGLAALF